MKEMKDGNRCVLSGDCSLLDPCERTDLKAPTTPSALIILHRQRATQEPHEAATPKTTPTTMSSTAFGADDAKRKMKGQHNHRRRHHHHHHHDVSAAEVMAAFARYKGQRKDHHIKAFKTPKETAIALVTVGEMKASYTIIHLVILSVLGGIYIGFGAFSATSASSITMPYNSTATPSTESEQPIFAGGALRRFIFALIFPVGLVPIVLFGAELFTSNVMTMTVGLLCRTVEVHRAAIVLVFSYFLNVTGCLLVAGLLGYFADGFDHDPPYTVLRDLTSYKTHLAWEAAFLRGILCNMVVCTTVFCAMVAEDVSGKMLVVYSLISSMVFMFAEHSIANTFLLPLGIWYRTPDVSFGRFLAYNLIPVTIGTVIGGIIIGCFVYFSYLHGETIPFRDPPPPHPEGRTLPVRNEIRTIYRWPRRRLFGSDSSSSSSSSPSSESLSSSFSPDHDRDPERDRHNHHHDHDGEDDHDEDLQDPVFRGVEHVV